MTRREQQLTRHEAGEDREPAEVVTVSPPLPVAPAPEPATKRHSDILEAILLSFDSTNQPLAAHDLMHMVGAILDREPLAITTVFNHLIALELKGTLVSRVETKAERKLRAGNKHGGHARRAKLYTLAASGKTPARRTKITVHSSVPLVAIAVGKPPAQPKKKSEVEIVQRRAEVSPPKADMPAGFAEWISELQIKAAQNESLRLELAACKVRAQVAEDGLAALRRVLNGIELGG